jgi:hypothetical protein
VELDGVGFHCFPFVCVHVYTLPEKLGNIHTY